MGNPQSMQSYPQFIGVLSCTSETPSGRLLLCLLSEGVVDGVGIYGTFIPADGDDEIMQTDDNVDLKN